MKEDKKLYYGSWGGLASVLTMLVLSFRVDFIDLRVYASSEYFGAGAVITTVACAQIILFRIHRATRTAALLTTGAFQYTRHPFYHIVLLLEPLFWYAGYWLWKFWIATAIYYLVLMWAAYLHEQEMLAKFGDAARTYYHHTPRLAVCYLFRKSKL